MHRWFFADEQVVCKEPTPTPSTSSPTNTPRTASPSSLPDTGYWKFCVKFIGNLCSHETLAVCGSCPVLGKWDVQHCLPLSKVEDSPCWTLTVILPRNYEVRYRYLVCATDGRGRRFVRFWETHRGARLICWRQPQHIDAANCDIFGELHNKHKIERGWITSDIVVVQFKFYRAPFILKTHNFKPLLYVKITPIRVKPQRECEKEQSNFSEKSQFIRLNVNEELKSTFAFCEVASLQDRNGDLHYQPKYGTSCGPVEILMFNLILGDVEHTVFLIDLYNYAPKAGADVPPYHFGYQYVLPKQLKGSEGTLKLTIMCATKHRAIGSMKCEYLVVKPLHSHHFNVQETFQRHWNTKHQCLDVGHRGCGNSFWFKNNILRENTINSFNLAFEHGADMVEFDIQLTKDSVPILYHDFQLYVSRKLNMDQREYDVMRLPLNANEMNYLKPFGRVLKSGLISLPLAELTLNQLKRVTDCPCESACVVDTKYNRPFQMLEKVFRKVVSKLGFIIEIKWPHKFDDGTMPEGFTPLMDKNVFVDVILDLVLRKADSRRIIFSSNDADICTMIRLKQNRYPVLFLVHANIYEKKYLDPRGEYIYTGIYFASAMELLGIIANCGDVIGTPGTVADTHERDLCVFCWGRDARMEKTRSYLKALGVDGIVFDRINRVLEPENLKHNVFLIELMDKIAEQTAEDGN